MTMTKAQYGRIYRSGYRLTVPAIGYTRRIQALKAIGYTYQQIVDEVGMGQRRSYGALADGVTYTRLRWEWAKKIDAAYQRLSVQPLHETTSAKRSRAHARNRGWAPPMAWDDIDNPHERPKGISNLSQLTPEAVAHIRALAKKGVQQKEIARRYGVGRSTVSRVVRGLIWRDVA